MKSPINKEKSFSKCSITTDKLKYHFFVYLTIEKFEINSSDTLQYFQQYQTVDKRIIICIVKPYIEVDY